MALVQMERIHIYAMKKDRKSILEYLQRQQMVEVSTTGLEDEIFSRSDTSTMQNLLGKNAETAEQAIDIIHRYVKSDTQSLAFLRGRQAISVDSTYDFYDDYEAVLQSAQRIVHLDRQIDEAEAEIAKVEALTDTLTPWMDLPVPQTFSGTRTTSALVGSLPGRHSLQDILTGVAKEQPEIGPVHVEIVFASKDMTAFYAIALKEDGEKLEDALRALGFTRPAAASYHMPQERRQELDGLLATHRQTLQDAEEEIRSLADKRDVFRMLQDHSTMRAEKYGVIEQLAQSENVFMLDGYIDASDADPLKERLNDRYSCVVETRELVELDDEPAKLKNNWFTEPGEPVLEGFGMPGRGEIDPTPVMSIFYYIMFGLMFSDFGYGLITFAVCLFALLRFRNMEPNWSKYLRLFMWCGLSTMFWGVLFSSYFGDIVDVVSRTFFGHEVSIPPVWFSPMEKPMLLLMFSLGIGLIHLTAGYIMNGVTSYRNGDYAGIIYDCVFAIVAWYPLVVILMGSTMFESMAGFKLNLPAYVTPLCLAITAVGVIGTLLTSGRESPAWSTRLLKGLYGVYDLMSGWLGDILSYSRLLALGLATGVVASVMNQLGSMVGGGVVGALVFIVVFIAGQGMNFGINILGAYVHSNRLEYVEFFGKFYEGGGRKFEPFGIHTEHYKIIEEDTSK